VRHVVAFASGWYLPGGQAVHLAAPNSSEYLPGVHSLQSVADTEPRLGFAEPSGHSVHWEASNKPVAVLYEPGGQGCQTMDDTAPASAQ
jgi:hypothetical protein